MGMVNPDGQADVLCPHDGFRMRRNPGYYSYDHPEGGGGGAVYGYTCPNCSHTAFTNDGVGYVNLGCGCAACKRSARGW